jgi:hypothetical protein
MRRGLPMGLVALAIVVWAWPLQHLSTWTRRDALGDVAVYHRYASAIVHGAIPYRDIHIEYPPGATFIFWLTWWIPGDYRSALSTLMLVCLCVCLLGVVATARALGLSTIRQAVAGGVVALSPLMLGPIVVERFDMAVAAVIAWMLYAAVTERWKLMWVLLAAGILIKLVPVALLPLLVIWQAHRVDWRAAIRGAIASLVIVAAGIIPFAVLSPSGTWYFIAYNLRRPPQLESMASNVYLVLHMVAHTHLTIIENYHSEGMSGAGPAALGVVSTVLLVALVVGCAIWSARRLAPLDPPNDAAVMMAGAAATMVALTVAGKVLSPQYMIWLLPATLLLPGRPGRAAIATMVAALVLTEDYYPLRYPHLVLLDPYEIKLLTLRNIVLIVLLVVCWPRAAFGRGRASSTDIHEPAVSPPIA